MYQISPAIFRATACSLFCLDSLCDQGSCSDQDGPDGYQHSTHGVGEEVFALTN
jgi:hypothetical protein